MRLYFCVWYVDTLRAKYWMLYIVVCFTIVCVKIFWIFLYHFELVKLAFYRKYIPNIWLMSSYANKSIWQVINTSGQSTYPLEIIGWSVSQEFVNHVSAIFLPYDWQKSFSVASYLFIKLDKYTATATIMKIMPNKKNLYFCEWFC